MSTRSKPNGDFFGKPVYAAVTEDYRITVYGPKPFNVSFFGMGVGLSWLHDYNMLKPVSFPLDFVFDTFFLPVDLIAWGMGNDKNDNPNTPVRKRPPPKDNSNLVIWSTQNKKVKPKVEGHEKNGVKEPENVKPHN